MSTRGMGLEHSTVYDGPLAPAYRQGRWRLAVTAIAILPFWLLLSVNPSDGVASMRRQAEERQRIVDMAHRMGMDPQALLDPEAYQARLARQAEANRELQVFWMRERNKPDPEKLAALN